MLLRTTQSCPKTSKAPQSILTHSGCDVGALTLFCLPKFDQDQNAFSWCPCFCHIHLPHQCPHWHLHIEHKLEYDQHECSTFNINTTINHSLDKTSSNEQWHQPLSGEIVHHLTFALPCHHLDWHVKWECLQTGRSRSMQEVSQSPHIWFATSPSLLMFDGERCGVNLIEETTNTKHTHQWSEALWTSDAIHTK